jgi:hypothetical protein
LNTQTNSNQNLNTQTNNITSSTPVNNPKPTSSQIQHKINLNPVHKQPQNHHKIILNPSTQTATNQHKINPNTNDIPHAVTTTTPEERRRQIGRINRINHAGTTESTTTESAQPPHQPRSPSHHRINPDRQATTESTQIGKPKPNQPRSASPSRINPDRQAQAESTGFVLRQKTQKTTPASPSHHRITTTTPATENPQKLFVLHNVQTPKKFQRREKFSCGRNPKKFSDRKFRLF